MIRGFACGVFDLFHAGHVLMLEECKQQCDYLFVALNIAENIDIKINPSKKPPLYSFKDRKLILESCKFVDEVAGYNSEDGLIEIMKNGNFNVRFLGDDYIGQPITSEEAIPNIIYIDRSHGKSTSRIKKDIKGFKHYNQK
tara:strand:- start:6006 stop:6428 length:423 start_codon:yes stop_codon:yes gene_type:complete